MEEHHTKRFHIRVWVICALGLFIDGYDLYISSVAEPFINAMYHPTPLMSGLTQAAAPIGAAIGALIIGQMADKIGRKSMLMLNLIFFVLIACLTACAWNNISLCIFRFLIGFGVGADYPICAAYLAEIIPKNKSSKFIATALFINCLAAPVGVIAAWIMFKLHPQIDVWRFMFLSSAIPATVGVLLRAKLPESFVWKAQQKIRQVTYKETILGNYKKLFSPQLVKTTLCITLCWFFQDISYYGIGLFTPYILKALHVSNYGDFLSSANEVLKSTLIVNLFVLAGAFLAIFFIEKINPLRLQKMGFINAFFGLLILSLSYSASSSINLGILFTGFIMFNFFINFGPAVTTYLLPTQVYETDIKATGHGLAAGAGKLGAFIGTIFLPIIHAKVGIYVTVGVLSITLLIGFMLTHLLSKEDVIENIHLEVAPATIT